MWAAKVKSAMLAKLLRVVILGAPASGKGTISGRIVRDFGLKHISSGDLLRSQVLKRTSVGCEAQVYMDKGELVPDDLMVRLINNELRILTSSWLLDGFPRTGRQAELLQDYQPVDVAISLNVPVDIIVERIKGRWVHPASGRVYNTDFSPPKIWGIDDVTGEPLIQRDDDKPEVVRQRLLTHNKRMEEVLKFYRDLDLLKEFKGTESNKIWPHVHRYLSEYIQPKSGP